MQQHLMQMQPMMAAYFPSNVTTDHIQQYLDENKSLILKIVESQNSGKLSECAENQARLQRNLMYLAAIADSQPQPPTMPGQYSSGGGIMQQGTQYMQGQQMTQQQVMAARSSLLYAQQPYSALQQQQALQLQSQLGMSSSATPTPAALHMLPTEAASPFPDFVRTTKPDLGISTAAEGRGEAGETLYLKPSDDAN